MKAKEFYKENEGKYFMYRGNKVRVVGVDVSNNRDYVIITYPKGWVIEDRFNNFSVNYFIDFSLCEKESKFYYVNSSNLIQIEQTELDLCELLNGCEGMSLYCTVLGECSLGICYEDVKLYASNNKNVTIELDKNGKHHKEGECLIFPSKENRDWSTFKKPIKIKKGTHVMCSNGYGWFLREYAGGKEVALDEGKLVGATVTVKYIVPATEFDFTDIESNKSKSII